MTTHRTPRKKPEAMNAVEARDEAERLGAAIRLHGTGIATNLPGKRADVIRLLRKVYDELREMEQ